MEARKGRKTTQPVFSRFSRQIDKIILFFKHSQNVHNNTEGPDVARLVVGLVCQNFRRDIVGRKARCPQALGFVRFQSFGKAEIREFYYTFGAVTGVK